MPGWDSFSEFISEAQKTPVNERQALVDVLLNERTTFPWVEPKRATFIYNGANVKAVALNLDTIKADPPFMPMEKLEGTDLFYVTYPFESDDLLDYLLAVDDPMTPLSSEKPEDLAKRVQTYWKMDPLNPAGMKTATLDVSVLRMPEARPFPDWSRMQGVNRGSTVEHKIDSQVLGVTGRKVWVHTPPNYRDSGLIYPLLILQDGQWAIGPLQVTHIIDTLIKHGRMAPVVTAMVQSGSQQERLRDYVRRDTYYDFVMDELLPFLQSQYRLDSTNLGIGGASAGAIAAADAALRNPAVFNTLIMLSPPLGKGPAQEKLSMYQERFSEARLLPRRIFHSVGRYEGIVRFLRPNVELAEVLMARTDIEYQFVETGSGHGLVTFRSMLPEALAWAFPGWASL
ncbi:MAG: alpha/beta hydrolase-fold protein [Chloroflexota bacterium]